MEHSKGKVDRHRIANLLIKSDENAERIAALWNAADGMTTEEAVKYIKHGPEMVEHLQDCRDNHMTHDAKNDLTYLLTNLETK